MAEHYMLGAYWAARNESIDECAHRLSILLTDLTNYDPVLSTWYERARSRDVQLEKRVSAEDHKYLRNLLERGRNRRDVGGSPIDDLGFRVGLWNGDTEGKGVGLNITCGAYWTSPNSNARISNCVILDFPKNLGELSRPESMGGVIVAVARAWQPDWAGVMSKEAMKARSFNAAVPFVDWMVFIPREIGGMVTPSSVTRLDGLGSLVITQPSPPSVADPEALTRIHRIEKNLLFS